MVFDVDEAVAITLLLPKFVTDTLQFDNFRVYPDATDNVPDPDTVPKLKVYDALIVKVYPELIERVPVPDNPDIDHVSLPFIVIVLVPNAIVPAPEIVPTENVALAPIVRVYPEAMDKVPAPETVATENVAFIPIVRVYPEAMDKVPAPVTLEKFNVTLELTVSVYPELICTVPVPFVIFVTSV
jgi:hypothetical protein